MFIPEEEFHSPQQHLHEQHHQGLEEDAQAADAGEKKKSFSTFGKDCQSEEESGDTCTSSLLSENEQRLPALAAYLVGRLHRVQ